MANIGNFDANQHEPISERGIIASGWYAMQIVNSEMRPTKSGGGNYLWIEYEMMESVHPDLKGRRVWDNLNLDNPSQQAVQIANRTLSAICRSVGVMQIEDSDQLHGKPLSIKIGIQQAKGEFEAKNKVNAYAAIADHFAANAAATAPAQAAPGITPTSGSSAAPPWQR